MNKVLQIKTYKTKFTNKSEINFSTRMKEKKSMK